MTGICRSPARKITIGAPKPQTLSRMMVDRAVSGFEIHPGPSMPKTARNWLTMPSTPKICFHRIATATDEPSSDGR